MKRSRQRRERMYRSSLESKNSINSKQSAEDKRNKERLVALLHDKKSFDDTKLFKLVSKHPKLCAYRYDWRHGSKTVNVFPLWRICEFRPSFRLVQKVYTAHPQALHEENVSSVPNLSWDSSYSGCESVEVMRFLVSVNQDCLLEMDEAANLPLLHVACYLKASPKAIRFLVSEHPDGLKNKDSQGQLPLHVACAAHAAPDLIRFLFTLYGDALKETDRLGLLPLHAACSNQASLETIYLLACQYQDSLKVKDWKHQFPLHRACNFGSNPEVIHFLTSHDRNALKEMNQDSRLPLHLACHDCCKASPEVVRILVSQYPGGLMAKDKDNRIPLHLACNNIRGTIKLIFTVVSHFSDSLDYLADNVIVVRWQISRKDKADFVVHTSEDQDGRLFAIHWDDTADARIVKAFKDTHTKSIAIIGGGMPSEMVSPIAEALRARNSLLHLGLGRNPVGDAGAELLAEVLKKNRVLQLLDVQGCSIGLQGLMSLLDALQVNKGLTDLDMSYNPGIFRKDGGSAIAKGVPTMKHLKRIYLFREDNTFPIEFVEFLGELMPLLHWNPSKFSPILLGQLLPHMVQAMYYYQQGLHKQFLHTKVPAPVWHYLFEQVDVMTQNNADMILFYVREKSTY